MNEIEQLKAEVERLTAEVDQLTRQRDTLATALWDGATGDAEALHNGYLSVAMEIVSQSVFNDMLVSTMGEAIRERWSYLPSFSPPEHSYAARYGNRMVDVSIVDDAVEIVFPTIRSVWALTPEFASALRMAKAKYVKPERQIIVVDEAASVKAYKRPASKNADPGGPRSFQRRNVKHKR